MSLKVHSVPRRLLPIVKFPDASTLLFPFTVGYQIQHGDLAYLRETAIWPIGLDQDHHCTNMLACALFQCRSFVLV